MSLDLQELTADWDHSTGEICARLIVGCDGVELVQLRVDLGVMQMFPDGRPDGQRYRGFPRVLDFIAHEQRLETGQPGLDDWRELEREVYQVNYRRLAFSDLAEEALVNQEPETAAAHLRRALRDIDYCLKCIELARAAPEYRLGGSAVALQPALLFHAGRLRTQLAVVQGRYDAAVEAAEQAEQQLLTMLDDTGLDEEQREQDPGVLFLRELAQRLRDEYDIAGTLQEQLEEAIRNEDFETAARLRDEIRQRQEEEQPPREDQSPPPAGL